MTCWFIFLEFKNCRFSWSFQITYMTFPHQVRYSEKEIKGSSIFQCFLCVPLLTIQFSSILKGQSKWYFTMWFLIDLGYHDVLTPGSAMIIINRGDNSTFFSDKVIHFDLKPVGSSDLITEKKTCYKSY